MDESNVSAPGAVAPPPPPIAPPVQRPLPPVIVERKSPGIAGFLSIFPGLGHIYLGLYQRAFAFAGAFVVFIGLSHRRGEFFGPLIGFTFFFAIIDAVRQAHAINRGMLGEGGIAPDPQLRRAAEGTGALTWGVILVGLGTLWLVDRYVDVDWSFMEQWGGPAALILLGLILVISHVRRKRREHEAGVGLPPRSY